MAQLICSVSHNVDGLLPLLDPRFTGARPQGLVGGHPGRSRREIPQHFAWRATLPPLNAQHIMQTVAVARTGVVASATVRFSLQRWLGCCSMRISRRAVWERR